MILGGMFVGYTLGSIAARHPAATAPLVAAEAPPRDAAGQIVGPPKPVVASARPPGASERKSVEIHPGDPTLGPHDVPVILVEFSDFECPFCAQASATVKRLQAEYANRVRFVFKHLPLPIHPRAQLAHEAAVEANEQGKFWEMKDFLFLNNRALSRADLERYAADLRLDSDRFRQALDDGRHRAKIEEDVRQAQALGISGTPAFLVNGRLVSGAVPYEQLKQVLDEELSLAGYS